MLSPGSEADLAEVVRASSGPLTVRGGGTRGGEVVGEVLSVAGIAGVTLYEPGALTLVAAAGTPLSEIEAQLVGNGQRLAFEPPDMRGLLGTEGVSTIGGVMAANASGPRRIQAGAARDFLLGVRFVDGTGAVIKNGGRVMKNVTGYDLVKLVAGSRGVLGVMTEVALKVLPRPEAEATLVLPLPADRAFVAFARALGSPFEVSGAAWWPDRGALIRVEGFADSVAYRAERLAALLSDFGAADLEAREASAEIWRQIRDVAPFHGAGGDVWRISVKPSDGPEVVRRLTADDVLLDWGGGLVWARLPEGTDARARLGDLPGHAIRLRGQGTGPALPPEPPAVAALTAGLRERFDPRGLFRGAA